MIPATRFLASLGLVFENVEGEGWLVGAPWLESTIHAKTWEEAYIAAIAEWTRITKTTK